MVDTLERYEDYGPTIDKDGTVCRRVKGARFEGVHQREVDEAVSEMLRHRIESSGRAAMATGADNLVKDQGDQADQASKLPRRHLLRRDDALWSFFAGLGLGLICGLVAAAGRGANA